MIKNYFLVALRNFWRHKTFSLINMLGLAIGISASLVIFLLIHYDLSFDRFEPQRDHIYRVVGQYAFLKDKLTPENCVPIPIAAAIEKEMTGFEAVAPFHLWGEARVSIPYPKAGQPKTLKNQKDLIAADARYTGLIGYTWLIGSPKMALSQPYQAVLTEKNATLYFPNMPLQDILGKTLTIDDTVQVAVSGIVKDLPGNSDFYFGTIISRSTLETGKMKQAAWDDWDFLNTGDQLFVRLKPGTNAAALEPLLTAMYRRNQDAKDELRTIVRLQPLSELHFDTTYSGFDNARTAHKPTLYGLMIVAAILLLLACINFINLTTAQASQRAREIGIRKTMGSQRDQLTFQFLSETFILTALATLLSIAITPLLVEVFSGFIPEGFHFSFSQPVIVLFLVALIITVTLLSGFYPALIMSRFNPILALKNQAYGKTATTRTAWFRKTLTVSQFVIAQVFIVATILVSKQISYALNMNMGFRKEAIIYFRTNRRENPSKQKALVTELKTIPGIDMLSVASNPPASPGTWTTGIAFNDGHQDLHVRAEVKTADSNYFRLYQLRLVAGHELSQSDTVNSIIINQSLATALGFRDPQKAVGRTIHWNERNPTIVGVAADFHQRSAHETIKSLLFANGLNDAQVISIALHPSNGNPDAWPTTISRIEKIFHATYPSGDFNYAFEDDTVAKFYTAEQKTARLLAWATALTIFISCLGLLGLVIFITNQRTKEIGIRKVIGAGVTRITLLLSKDFIKLIGIAILIAMPLSWWGSYQWLQNFAYRTDLSWWLFASGGAFLLLIALIILCLRTIKAASANPVNSLRSE